MKQPAVFALISLFLLGTTFVNGNLVDEAHNAGMTDEQMKHEAAKAHAAGITNGEIAKEVQHAHEAGLTDEQIADRLQNAKSNHSDEDIVNNIKDAEHAQNTESNHASTNKEILDEAHNAGITDSQIAHEANKAHEAGYTNEQIANAAQSLHQQGKTDAEILEMAKNFEQSHSGNGSGTHTGNGSGTHTGNGNQDHQMTEDQLIAAAHAAGLSNEDIKHEEQMAHDAGFSDKQMTEVINQAHNAGLSEHQIIDKIHAAEHKAQEHANHNANTGSQSKNNKGQNVVIQNHPNVEKLNEVHPGAHAFYTGDEVAHAPDGISKGEKIAYGLLSIVTLVLFGIFISFLVRGSVDRKNMKNKKNASVDSETQPVIDNDIV